METKNYYLGLDLGTNSVGWAVTDENYQLLRYKGKDLWGIREFEEAKTSVERRTNRTSRRRRQREVARIGYLKDCFHEAIEYVDPHFLVRLENSKYHLEDKDNDVQYNFSLFNDSNFTDIDYYNAYPTIFHLRKELIENPEPHDVRLVYLAILNMFKHRGHFLNTGELGNLNAKDAFDNMKMVINDSLSINMFSNVSSEQIIEILSNPEFSRTSKKEHLIDLLQIEKNNKNQIEIIKAICGLKTNGKILFNNVDLDKDTSIEFDFSDFSFDEKVEDLTSLVGDENFNVISSMKVFYDCIVLSKTLGKHEYLSFARCESYEKHHEQLLMLKKVYKNYLGLKKYNYMFRSEEKGTYSAYVNSNNTKKPGETKVRRNFKDRKIEDLYKTIKKDLELVDDSVPEKKMILTEISNETFLLKQLTASNGVIPNQVHKKELKAILCNAEKYLPFLNVKDEYGLTVSQKIIQLFEFQIPYYVGPLGKTSKTGWAVRKEEGPILPWNLENKIDLKETSQQFIERMIRRCTYITNETVHALPKHSLMYQTYCVLNEINNIKIYGEKIPVSLKQELYNEVYLNHKKVTRKTIVSFFKTKGLIQDDNDLSGIDMTINNQLSTYYKFKEIIKDKINEDEYKNMIEDIVFWITIFADKKMVKEQILAHYQHLLDDSEIKRILSLKFSDWGRLSKEFFELQGMNKKTGEYYSIIRMLWETNDNLNGLLSQNDYTFIEELNKQESKMNKLLSELSYDDLDNTYLSSPVKRMVWQTILIIKELEEILGSTPTRIFLEMTRRRDEKPQRSIPRKQKFIDLYKSIKDEEIDWKDIINKSDENGKLNTKKMYLYLTQKGRCMYTGERIELSDLFNKNLYDIDHIYPRHFVKDDNIDNNLVLVKKEKNNHKSDTFPIEQSIQFSCQPMWKALLEQKLITKEKYDRLTSRQALTDEQKIGFIARQVVETSQGTKGIGEILKNVIPQVDIVYSKASNVSDFRHIYKISKSRLINDFHHAHDAYLNIVVGNVYDTKFTQNPRNFIEKDYHFNEKDNHYNLSKMYEWDVCRNGKTAWVAEKDNHHGTISIVKKTLSKSTPMMTRMSFEKAGQLTEATIVSKKEAKKENYIPVKTSDAKLNDVTKYGGKTSIASSYFILVEHQKGKKKIRTLEIVPVYLKDKVKRNGIKVLQDYCELTLNLVKPVILLSKIALQSLIKYNGYYLHITGKTENRLSVRNAVNLVLDSFWINYVHKIEKYIETKRIDKELSIEKNIEFYDILTDKHLNTIYAKRPNPVGIKLQKAKEKFILLNSEEQLQTLYQILKLTEIGLNAANLKSIGESTNTGKMLISKVVTNANQFILIHQSVTGIYERQIDLLSDDLAHCSD